MKKLMKKLSYIAILLFIAISCSDNVEEVKKAPTLTFTKLVTNKILIDTPEILKQIQGDKDGYTIKSIGLEDKYKNVAEIIGLPPQLKIAIKTKKATTFKATVVLEKNNYLDVIIQNAEFEKQATPINFIFTKISTGKSYILDSDILGNISGDDKTGWSIKNIINISDTSVAIFNQYTKSLDFKKTGKITAIIVLKKSDYKDFIIINCEFEREKLDAPNFTFTKRTTTSDYIFMREILQNISGANKTGWSVKSVTNISDTSVAIFDPHISIDFKKIGKITATITLQKQGYKDAIIINCEFEREKLDAPNFTFTKRTTTSDYIFMREILQNISGANKTGWSVKSVTNISDTSVAIFNPHISIDFKKIGKITATITLQKQGYEDAIIRNCIFVKNPTTVEISRIDILKFPEFKPDGSNWDPKYAGQSSDVIRPDLVWKILRNSVIYYSLPSSYRDSNARQGLTYSKIFRNHLKVSNYYYNYTFKLYDYDTTSDNDYMGSVDFHTSKNSLYEKSKIFTSGKISIKVYFTYK